MADKSVSSQPCSTKDVVYERKMGDSELSYYLPSRAAGVNDMYLHLGFKAPGHLITRDRMSVVWAIFRLAHPLLASKVQMYDYDDVRFVFRPPTSPEDAIEQAKCNIAFRSQDKDELIDSYLNGPRILSNKRISYLILSSQTDHSVIPHEGVNGVIGNGDASFLQEHNYDLLICAAHFIGDGMALHQFAHDFFTMLGSDKSLYDLQNLLSEEWQRKWSTGLVHESVLPCSIEESLPYPVGRFRRAVAKVDFDISQSQLIGGHSFPRRSAKNRHTIVPTISFDEVKTKAMLKSCKAHGVTISAAIFAICNIVWSRMHPNDSELPMMMYSASNLRPYMPKPPSSYWFLAVGYFNVVLPTLLPKGVPVSSTFWHRARTAKDKSTKAVKNSMVVYRTHEMAKERGIRARAWGKEDDERENGTWVPTPQPSAPKPLTNKPPSKALIGLSLLGNLDGIYKHQDFAAVKMHTLTTGSRQRTGAMLLFGYTFVGKLWLSLGYDEVGFEDEAVRMFWNGLEQAVSEFLINS